MALTYNRQVRTLDLRGVITLNSGTQISIAASDILAYSISESSGSEGLPLGSAEASSFSLTISNVGKSYLPSMFDNAEVHMEIGIDGGDGTFTYSDFGVWYVCEATAPEQSVSIDLNGYDALATLFEADYTDAKSAYPTTLGSLAATICAAAGIHLQSAAFRNADIAVSSMPEWGDTVTLRTIIGFIAACAGGFARMTRGGKLEIVSYCDGSTYAIDSNFYTTLTRTNGSDFKFNSLQVKNPDSDDEETSYTRYAVNTSLTDNPTNTIRIEDNPLFTDGVATSVKNLLNGISATSASLTWVGDPAVRIGDKLTATDTSGNTLSMLINFQMITFSGGLSSTSECNLPALNTANSGSYTSSGNIIDSNGNIRVTRIANFDKSVVSATVGHFEELTAASASVDKLLAGIINAITLRAENIDASSVTTDILTSAIAEIINATIRKLNAGTITTDELYAAYAELIALKAGTITADNIETDALAAELARITVLACGSATFDKATVQHLVAEAMNLQFGTAGQVFIQNLAVEYAQMVGAAIGNLCIKASDGSYYSLDVSADGSVTATPTTVTEGEISAGETGSGRVILETNITAANLNTSNLLATYALINKIDAARIDVAELFAQRAFIDLLTTSNIFGGKSLTMIAGQVEQNATDIARNNIHTGTEPPEAPIPDGKLWVDTAQDPNVIRRWLGQDVSTERDYTASASGNPVETPPGTVSFDILQSVLLPVQAGSGDPSPDNIRPISGRTVAMLTRCGKNLMDLSQGYGYNELKPLNAPVGTPITFSLFPTDGTSQFNGRIVYDDDTTHDFAIIGTNADNNIWHTYTITPEKHIKEYSIYDTDGSSIRTISKGMIEYGSTATTFEPYQGDTYTADFGQTVYGGTLDWLTGVLTVEWGLISSYADEALSGEWISDRDVYSTGATPTTGAQIAYKLATPITIQLPPATVTALKGVNTLHTDADSVSVAYTASGWEIVNDLSGINDVSNRLLAQQAAAQQAIDQLATAITVDSDGAHFYKPGYRAQNEVRIDQDSVDILVGGSVNSSFVAGGLILGNYMLWHPEAAGGLAFNLI